MNTKSAIVFGAALLAVCTTAVAGEQEFSSEAWRACRGRAKDCADKEFASEFIIDGQGWSVDLGVPYFESAGSQMVFKKYDETGRLVKIGEESDFPELEKYFARFKELHKVERSDYAKSIGLTYEEAMELSTNRVSLLRSRRMLRNNGANSRLLEPLMPFDEALENAKTGNATGFYALAMHYAKGDEVPVDSKKATLFLQKAGTLDYPNAVFVTALAMEANATSSVKDASGGRLLSRRGEFDVSTEYIGTSYARFKISGLSLERDDDVAAIRSCYERAVALGVAAATNEVERFEKRVAYIAEKILSQQSEEASRNAKNEAASALIADELESLSESERETERRQREMEREELRMQQKQIGSLRSRRLIREQQRLQETADKAAVEEKLRREEEARQEEERRQREMEREEQRAELLQIQE